MEGVEGLILNVGCGGRPKDKASWYGDVRIDIERLNPVTVLMDAHYLALRDKVFTKIVSFEVLEHLADPVLALREFHRVAKDDAVIQVSVPNAWYWRDILMRLRLGHNPNSGHRHNWNVHQLLKIVNQVGFELTAFCWLDWYRKGRLKTGFLEPFLRLLSPIAFMHMHVTLKKVKC